MTTNGHPTAFIDDNGQTNCNYNDLPQNFLTENMPIQNFDTLRLSILNENGEGRFNNDNPFQFHSPTTDNFNQGFTSDSFAHYSATTTDGPYQGSQPQELQKFIINILPRLKNLDIHNQRVAEESSDPRWIDTMTIPNNNNIMRSPPEATFVFGPELNANDEEQNLSIANSPDGEQSQTQVDKHYQHFQPGLEVNSQRILEIEALMQTLADHKWEIMNNQSYCNLKTVLKTIFKFLEASNAIELMREVWDESLAHPNASFPEGHVVIIDGFPISHKVWAETECQQDLKLMANLLLQSLFSGSELLHCTLKARVLKNGIKSTALDPRRINVIFKVIAWMNKNRGLGNSYGYYNPNDPNNPSLTPSETKLVREGLGQKRNNCNQGHKQNVSSSKISNSRKVISRRKQTLEKISVKTGTVKAVARKPKPSK